MVRFRLPGAAGSNPLKLSVSRSRQALWVLDRGLGAHEGFQHLVARLSWLTGQGGQVDFRADFLIQSLLDKVSDNASERHRPSKASESMAGEAVKPPFDC